MGMFDSIRAQASAALAAGVVAVLLVGVAIAAWSVDRAEGTYRGGFDMAMVALAVAAERLPVDDRPALSEAAAGAGLLLRSDGGGELIPDGFTRGLAERLRHHLVPLGIDVVAVGHEPAPADQTPRLWEHSGDIVVRLSLSDGSILEFAEQGRWSLPDFLLQALPVVVAVGLGLALLSVWVARRVTAPLERFAGAAERLGRDLNAPALDAAGPREIRRAAGVLNQSQRRIQRLLDDRTHMLAAIAHDLRTPIMRLYLRAELLSDSTQRAKMEGDLAEMEAMIDGALAFAREEHAPQPRHPVNLGEILTQLEDELTEAGGRVSVMPGEPVRLEADPRALKRALGNLLGNAVRYGEKATVSWRVHPDRLEIIIDDEGPGIPEAELERVFSPFYRLEPSRSRESGGSGLGMAVARSVIRGHGGDIELANRAEGGLRQRVVLPGS